ncbi:MAG: AraC family transcriptional regulator [Hymenobacteraceae bacterium]|nr:AraC family transcriptional regulator [Hymenobacteraceae bacterium]
MFLKEFPDYNWLKQQAEKAFRGRLDVQGKKLEKEGWPVVVLNTSTTFCARPDIKGPFSLFTNIRGNSNVQVGSKEVTVSEDSFLITNRSQYYSLNIESDNPVETFNLHLGQNAWEDFTYTCTASDAKLLENPDQQVCLSAAEFPNVLQVKSQPLQVALGRLYQLSKNPVHTQLQFEEELVYLFQALVPHKKELLQAISRLPQVKQATRQELFRRISLATDYILSDLGGQPSLDELAQLACLSRFHFLRIFSAIYRTTPHQFILQHKVMRSQRLLRQTSLPVGEVGLLCGFEEASSFNRCFSRYVGCSPAVYRQQAK